MHKWCHVFSSSPWNGHKMSLRASTVLWKSVAAVLCSLFCFVLFKGHCFTGFCDWQPSYPVHPKEDAWPALRIAIVGVLQPWALPQPRPLELARFPLCALLQVVLHEVSVLCAADILLLLNAIVIRWKWRAGRKRPRGGEEEWESERGGHT